MRILTEHKESIGSLSFKQFFGSICSIEILSIPEFIGKIDRRQKNTCEQAQIDKNGRRQLKGNWH